MSFLKEVTSPFSHTTHRVQRQDTLLGAFCSTLHEQGLVSTCGHHFLKGHNSWHSAVDWPMCDDLLRELHHICCCVTADPAAHKRAPTTTQHGLSVKNEHQRKTVCTVTMCTWTLCLATHGRHTVPTGTVHTVRRDPSTSHASHSQFKSYSVLTVKQSNVEQTVKREFEFANDHAFQHFCSFNVSSLRMWKC